MSATLDQVVAQHIGQDTTLPSLELAAETTQQAAACSGSACFYNTTLSFRDAHSPLPMEYNPRKVFAQLFGEGDTPEERAAIANQTKSLLDRITGRTRALRRIWAPAIAPCSTTTWRRCARSSGACSWRRAATCRPSRCPKAPIGELDAFDEQVDLLFDLIALAYQADLTRVASYIMVAEGTNRTYNHIGVSDSFHPVSHHANDLDRLEKLVKIQTWHMERFAAFVSKLAAVPDGDGTLLDHSMFLYGSNMSNSDRHNGHPLPTILVGGGNGTLRGGQHIEPAQPTPLANLHLTILDKVGATQKSFGDSTGTIAGV